MAGRRSGKSRMAAAVAIYLALFVKHRLAPGEKGMALVLAGSIDQAKTVFGYVRGFLEATPALAREVAAVKRPHRPRPHLGCRRTRRGQLLARRKHVSRSSCESLPSCR